jgi:adenylate cyclase
VTGYDDEGEATLAPNDRWQFEVYRERPGASSPVCSRWVEPSEAGFDATTACRGAYDALLTAKPSGPPETVEDPTSHFGFTTPVSKAQHGQTLSSDLAWSQRDLNLPVTERRVTVTALKSIESADGVTVGVLKVGLVAGQLSETIRNTRVNPEANDGFSVFLCDGGGRLITGFDPHDVPVEDDDDLRVDASCAPPEVAQALGSGMLRKMFEEQQLEYHGVVEHGGRRFLVSFRHLPDTQGWNVGVVGPESFYYGRLEEQRYELLWASVAVLVLVSLLGVFSLRVIQGSLRTIENETARMSRFEFAPSNVRSSFADVQDALESLEHAKTAMRSMGKYVPLDLVRRLFRDNVEPVPGGELREVSLMFTDIEGFTTLVENEPPDRLAGWLGQYLSMMTAAVHATSGTVDKFIGDAVMALWNAPSPDPHHVLNACRGALRCIQDAEKLFASAAWQGRPPLVTRFGLHVAPVMVGHFGAPDRLSYTAIGDGVNLASRLEALNKEYETRVLVSEAVYKVARGSFAFRHVDRVAVKGKLEAVDVYELLGDATFQVPERIARYEAALALYCRRDFTQAAGMLAGLDDGPSRTLAARCMKMRLEPPPPDWSGVWTLHTK